MVKSIINSLVSMLGRNSNIGWERDMLTWAKTEYGKDWQYAYQYMITHKGQAPTIGVTI
jgi:hypothetical protein